MQELPKENLGIGEWDSSTSNEPEEGTQSSGISLPNDIVEAYTGNHVARQGDRTP